MAEPPSTPAGTWETDGVVDALARSDHGTVYLGGEFAYIGPSTGHFVGISTAGSITGAPSVNGDVSAIASDGAGGWYIGGQFSQVAGVTRNRAAHILADGTLDPSWNPNLNGTVHDIAVSGSTVYLGGEFTAVGGVTRNRIAAVDAVTGSLTVWNPNAEGAVRALAVSGSTVYAGGDFISIGGQQRVRVAALDASTGAPTTWNPGVGGLTGSVRDLAVAGSVLFIGGTFTSAAGIERNNAAAVHVQSGAPTAWNPNANDAVDTVEPSGSVVYIGGAFTSAGGVSPANPVWRLHVAAVDVSSGEVTAWNPGADGRVSTIRALGSSVYIGGAFKAVGGQPRARLAEVEAATGAVASWDPRAQREVLALAASGPTIAAGGAFTSAGGVLRSRLAEVSLSTGTATSWNPGPDGRVFALATSGSTVYAGGDFTSVGGQARSRIAAINAAGNATSWNPNATARVSALATSGSTVYAGGEFYSVGGQFRSGIAAIDAAGNATSWNPNPTGSVFALATSGSTLYAAGSFTSIGGQTRRGIAAIDAAGNATSWNPNADVEPTLLHSVRALAVSGSTVYAGGYFSSVGGQLRSNIAAIDAAGNATSWNPNANGTVSALSVSDSTVYAGGEFTSIGGTARNRIAALGASGAASGWNPNADSPVRALVASGSNLYAGGEFAAVGGATRPRFAAFVATPVNSGLPGLSGTPRVGTAANSSIGNWANDPGAYGYQWLRNGSAIADASAESYTPTDADTARNLAVRVTASNLGGSASAESAPVTVEGGPVNDSPPSIAGVATETETLTAQNGAWRAHPAASFEYQWLRCTSTDIASCAEIVGGTSATYVLRRADVGKYVRVEVKASNPFGTLIPVSDAIGAVAAASPVNTALPAISGVPRDAEVLTAQNGNWDGFTPMEFTHQWRRCDTTDSASCSDIAGADQNTYGLSSGDVGKRVRVRVTASNDIGSDSVESAPTGAVEAVPPVNSALPVISGLARDDDLLTATDGSWAGSTPMSFNYRWVRCEADGSGCLDIAGATGNSYRLTSEDVDSRVKIRVTGSNAGGAGPPAVSALTGVVQATPPVNRFQPTVDGLARSEEMLVAGIGTWFGSVPMSFAYQWQRCALSCADIPGAVDGDYTLTALDVGYGLRVRVTATNLVGNATAFSGITSPVAADAPRHPPHTRELPAVTGVAGDGETLTATRGRWVGSEPMLFGYQWQRCNAVGDIASCSDITGAGGETYTATAADIGSTLRIAVTATNAVDSVPAYSAVTQLAIAVPPANTSPPRIVGVARVGLRLQGTAGLWEGSEPMAHEFQWLTCAGNACEESGGATGQSYTVREEDRGRRIRLRVVTTNAGGSEPAVSEATEPVEG